ncbi:chromosome segregation ATPase [Burkholderia pseudomallei]|nr:chromosome segregation ATPase [Burkholderia pseudomallei]CAJ4942245.1 chromosome segregation ATPase [Burkholderia pseudomallei]CAJ8879037.1 chromosome segregation ATPase [Burkholderia pseudomallei]
MPLEVDVDSDVTELSVVLRPVDSEPIPVLVVDSPVDVDVDSEVS